MDDRLPAHLEVAGLIRATQSAGGFAAVLKKGERSAGNIILVMVENGQNARIYERVAKLDGTRNWARTRIQDPENKADFESYLNRMVNFDPDLWLVELDVANGERLIATD